MRGPIAMLSHSAAMLACAAMPKRPLVTAHKYFFAVFLVLLPSGMPVALSASRKQLSNNRQKLREVLLVRGGSSSEGISQLDASSETNSRANKAYVDRIVQSRRGFYSQVLREVEPQTSRPGENSTFCVQQVQGSGDCLFHAIAIGIAFEDEGEHLDMHDPSLSERVRALRTLAVDTLTAGCNRTFHLEGDEYIPVSELVAAAAQQYNMTPEAYCESMRRTGEWGGGPEILALVNAMRRPIHVFEPIDACNGTEFRLQLCGAFGSPRFDDCAPRVCIVAADDKFPKCKPVDVKRHGEGGCHFLALLPTAGKELGHGTE